MELADVQSKLREAKEMQAAEEAKRRELQARDAEKVMLERETKKVEAENSALEQQIDKVPSFLPYSSVSCLLAFHLSVPPSLALPSPVTHTYFDLHLQVVAGNTALEEEIKKGNERLTELQAEARHLEADREAVVRESKALVMWARGSRGMRRAFWLLCRAVERSRIIDEFANRVWGRLSLELKVLVITRWARYVRRR